MVKQHYLRAGDLGSISSVSSLHIGQSTLWNVKSQSSTCSPTHFPGCNLDLEENTDYLRKNLDIKLKIWQSWSEPGIKK